MEGLALALLHSVIDSVLEIVSSIASLPASWSLFYRIDNRVSLARLRLPPDAEVPRHS
jgi:hypothetical protein